MASLEQLVARVLPGARILGVAPLGSAVAADHEPSEPGPPLRVDVETAAGERRSLVLHVESADGRRGDAARRVLAAHDAAASVLHHVEALDCGALLEADVPVSLARARSFYRLGSFAGGRAYAADLARIARDGRVGDDDLARCDRVAAYLVSLHADRSPDADAYRRALFDVVAGEDGILARIDEYPPDVGAALAPRLERIEHRCLEWRRRLRSRTERVARIHGAFHPRAIFFGPGGTLAVADAGRGAAGDPADDVVCLATHFAWLALGSPGAWGSGLGVLWRRLFRVYLDATGDIGVLEVAPLHLAARAVFLASPARFPSAEPAQRDRLLAFAEQALDRDRFDPHAVEDLFRGEPSPARSTLPPPRAEPEEPSVPEAVARDSGTRIKVAAEPAPSPASPASESAGSRRSRKRRADR